MLFFSFAFITMHCHPASKTMDEESLSPENKYASSVKQIKSLSMRWERWYNEQNVDSITSLYTSDAMIISGNKSAVAGKEKIRSFYSDQFEQTDGIMKLTIESVQIRADVAIERGAGNLEYGSKKACGKISHPVEKDSRIVVNPVGYLSSG